jgi:hypothetical protein
VFLLPVSLLYLLLDFAILAQKAMDDKFYAPAAFTRPKTDVSEVHTASIIRTIPIISLMMEAVNISETSVYSSMRLHDATSQDAVMFAAVIT